MELEKFKDFMLRLEPEIFVNFIDGQNNVILKKDLISQFRQEKFDELVYHHLEETIGRDRYFKVERLRRDDIKFRPYDRDRFSLYNKYLKTTNPKYRQLVINAIIKNTFPENYPIHSNNIRVIEENYNFLKKKNIFTNELLQSFVNDYIKFLYEKIYRTTDYHYSVVAAKEENIGKLFSKANNIRIEDAEMLYEIAIQNKELDSKPIKNIFLKMKVYTSSRMLEEEVGLNKLGYQRILAAFAKNVSTNDMDLFAEKILNENSQYNINVVNDFAYKTPELREDLKEKFKQILKEKEFWLYELNEKIILKKQQQQQKKLEKQDARKKILQKLPLCKNLLHEQIQEKPREK